MRPPPRYPADRRHSRSNVCATRPAESIAPTEAEAADGPFPLLLQCPGRDKCKECRSRVRA